MESERTLMTSLLYFVECMLTSKSHYIPALNNIKNLFVTVNLTNLYMSENDSR